MPYSVEGKLVVAISSRALFDFEEENRVFERDDDRALHAAAARAPRRAGAARASRSRWCRSCSRFNADGAARRGRHPVAQRPGLGHARVPLGASGYGLPIAARRVHARAQRPWRYLRPLRGQPVPVGQRGRRARARSRPACRRRASIPQSAQAGDAASRRSAHRLRRRRRAVLRRGRARLPARRPRRLPARTSRRNAAQPLPPGPFKPLLEALHRLQHGAGNDAHAHPHRARHRAQRAGARARDPHADGLEHRGRRGDVPRRPRTRASSCASSSPTSSSTTSTATSTPRARTSRPGTCPFGVANLR